MFAAILITLLKPCSRKEALAKWGPNVPILDKIIDSEIRAIGNEEVVLVGTIIKTLKLRGSVCSLYDGPFVP